MQRLPLILSLVFYCLPVLGNPVTQPDLLQQLHLLNTASLLVEDNNGNSRHKQKIHQAMIPASTIKLLTAYLALKKWGPDHRFHTDFYLSPDNQLVVKGYGDPFLVSEELDIIVTALLEKGLIRFSELLVDTSYFSDQLTVTGQSNTNNPYDAAPGSLASNFNTIFIKKSRRGISSAEPQTPLTKTARQLGASVWIGEHRINLGKQDDGAMYFAELLVKKLAQKNIFASGGIRRAKVNEKDRLFYRHYNSRTLAEIIKGMLEYSNNFIANQVFLNFGAESIGPPATMSKSREAFMAAINAEFSWKNFRIVEGAGLSRKNLLSAQQLVDVLNKLKPYADLLPAQNHKIRAKTGTLQNVSSYAGYIKQDNKLNPFALIINQSIDPDFRFRLAEQLSRQ